MSRRPAQELELTDATGRSTGRTWSHCTFRWETPAILTGEVAESYVEGGDTVVVVVGTRAMVMLTALPIFTLTPAAGS